MELLTPGTRVGAWWVRAWQGQGGYGAVYLAERGGFRRSERGALKVSLWLWNGRMAREVELLSRVSHPSIPRLLDRGGPRNRARDEYPFFVMEFVEGPPLYAWAEQHSPSSQQLCRVLAQLARALEALHAEGAVHRDVKGANVLVRLSDRRAMLIDFGTWQSLPPMTREYLSPQKRTGPSNSSRLPSLVHGSRPGPMRKAAARAASTYPSTEAVGRNNPR